MRGKDAFLNWIKRVHPELHRWTLENLNHHPSVYMVEFEDPNCEGDCFSEHFEQIFKAEVAPYVRDGIQFPKTSYARFQRWFAYQYHESVYDLSDKALDALEK